MAPTPNVEAAVVEEARIDGGEFRIDIARQAEVTFCKNCTSLHSKLRSLPHSGYRETTLDHTVIDSNYILLPGSVQSGGVERDDGDAGEMKTGPTLTINGDRAFAVDLAKVVNSNVA